MVSVKDLQEAPLTSSLESVTKAATLLVIASYAIGYLIVAINDNAHGFLETSLIKPRAVAAGAIFILFTALPISLTQGAFFPQIDGESESTGARFSRLILGTLDYFSAFSAAGLLILIIFPKDELHSLQSLQAISLLVIFTVVAVNGFLRFSAPRMYRIWPAGWILFGIVSICLLGGSIYMLRALTIVRVLYSSFIVTAFVNLFVRDIKRGISLNFKVTALIALFVLWANIYATKVFPYVSPLWGGGLQFMQL